jgi:hypothetical protein
MSAITNDRAHWRGPGFQLVLLVLAVIAGWFMLPSREPAAASPDVATLYQALQARLDPAFPGRGITDYPGNTSDDVPKGYAMILKAELLAMRGKKVSDVARNAARFLLEHSDERKDGFPGWGVPLAWDPYGDGSINQAHTKYTISTAIVVDALLDWIERDAEATRDRALSLIREAIRPYLAPDVLSPSGLLPYSLEAVDRPYDTFNPAGYMAGVMQRYSRLEQDAALAQQIRLVADKTVAAHLAQRKLRPDGSWFWHYSITEHVPNDLAHAGYIILGMQMYAQHGGTLRDRIDLKGVEQHLADFVDRETKSIIAWPNFRTDTNTPARSYDLGMGMYLVCQGTNSSLRQTYLASLDRYRGKNGEYLKYPPKAGQVDLAVREYEAYILLGIASCLPQGAQ